MDIGLCVCTYTYICTCRGKYDMKTKLWSVCLFT